MDETYIGEVDHYFNRIGVAVLNLSKEIQIGDQIHVLGYTTDFYQEVSGLQIEHMVVNEATPGDDVALKVMKPVRKKDEIFKAV